MAPDSPQMFGVALMAMWGTAGAVALGRSMAKSPAARELALAIRKMNLAAKGALVAGLVCAVAIGGTQPGGTNDPPRGLRSPPATVAVEPSFAPVEVRTNNVALRAESASAVEMEDWRKHGSSSGGVWLDFDEPVFRIGTNPVFRAHVAASGAVSFDSMRRPPVGAPLPDGTGLPALAPLLAPLGMVPEANWTSAGAASRFWHDAAPGRGRVFTWEEALLDRLPGRRVSVQTELLPSGDFTYRYDFSDALDPPATNLVIGAQVGTNGVNALAILGTNTLAATVWRVDGACVANGVSIADLLCTNGVLRTPTRFAIEWKNASGLSPNADTDGDGLSDWDDSSVTDDDDLVSLSIVLVQDSPVGGTVSVSPVSSTTAMRVWTDRAKTTPLTFPVEWAVSASSMFESTVYLEGGTPSASLSGTGLRAEFVPETGESTAETTFLTTVVKASRIESPGAPTTGLAVLAGTSVPFRIALIPAGMETASIVVWKTARRKFDGGYRPWTNIMQSFSSTATTYGFPNPGIYRVSADVTVCGAATRTVHYLRTGRDPYDAPKIERWNHVGVAATQRQLALREFALGRLGSTQFAFKGTLLAYNGFSSIRKPPT